MGGVRHCGRGNPLIRYITCDICPLKEEDVPKCLTLTFVPSELLAHVDGDDKFTKQAHYHDLAYISFVRLTNIGRILDHRLKEKLLKP